MKNTIQVNGKRKTCRIFDAGADSFDRYTIAFKGYRLPHCGMVYPYIAASARPFHAQGLGLHLESKEFMTGRHLGKRVSFDALPDQVKSFILQRI